ncbi:MAG: FAD:protein FMN transferase [Eubacteriales bacterium]|nr:FAD:protein FMN transferase [Eubacteriales bacterium]
MRIFRLTAVTVMLSIILMISSACQPGMKRYTDTILGAFDTVITVIAYCESDQAFEKLSGHAETRFIELHQLFDRYNQYDGVVNIHTLNAHAGQGPLKVDPELIRLLEQAGEWYRQSPGTTNIAFGSVLELWHDARTEGLTNPAAARLPEMAALTEAARHTDMDQLLIDKAAGTVELADGQMRLDLGAVAKGYATELVAQELISMGYPHFIISSGGNVRTAGNPQDGKRSVWSIGIQNPDAADDGEELLDTAYLTDLSVVTSGDYQRYYTVDGQRYHHIIDPATLKPGVHHRAVTVITRDSGFADFLSTTLFLLPYADGRNYIDQLPGTEALWVLADGSLQYTDGVKNWFKTIGGATNPSPVP